MSRPGGDDRAADRGRRLVRRLAPPTVEGVATVGEALDAWARASGVGADRRRELLLAWDELGSNVANHAGGARELFVGARRLVSGAVVLVLLDDGRPFDPLRRRRPRTDQALADRAVGGLGIHLVRELAARLAYERRGRHNRLRLELHP